MKLHKKSFGRIHKAFSLARSHPQVTWSVILLMTTLSLSCASVLNNKQLERMDLMAEEYLWMGLNLYSTGSFHGSDSTPSIQRPPGYPFFIATILKLSGVVPNTVNNQEERQQAWNRIYTVIYLAQCILLALSVVVLFIWMVPHLSRRNAFTLALLFGINPYMIILTGLIHYEVLHIFMMIVSGYALSVSIREHDISLSKIIFAGGLWGLSTLVRPVTLILPAFVFFMLLIIFRADSRILLKGLGGLVLGMTLIIGPYTIRNYMLTERLIFVNAQSSIAFWSGTVRKMDRMPNNYKWWDLWYSDGMPIFEKVTGENVYSSNTYAKNVLELQDAFRSEAIRNIRTQPQVYLYNTFQNFMTINIDINSVLLRIFEFIQISKKEFDMSWLDARNPRLFYSSPWPTSFEVFIYLITITSLIGIGRGFWIRDRFLIVPFLIYLCVCIAHSITYMDLMYYYIKIPFLFIFFGFGVQALDLYKIKTPINGKMIGLGSILNVLMVLFVLILIDQVIFF